MEKKTVVRMWFLYRSPQEKLTARKIEEEGGSPSYSAQKLKSKMFKQKCLTLES